MNKLLATIFFFSLLAACASATSLFERTFAEMGYSDFAVEGAQQTGCQNIQFILPDIDMEPGTGKLYPIASLGFELHPIQEGIIDLNISLNGELIAQLDAEDLRCGEEPPGKPRHNMCWHRLWLPEGTSNPLVENTLRVCIGTGDSITRITMSSQSKIGLYQTADFRSESAFRVEAEKTRLVIGEKTKITMLIHNQGSAAADVEVQYARPVAEDKPAFSVVEGKNYFEGSIDAGEQKEITYIIKPRKAIQMTMPPAIIYYKNEFGEQTSKFSNLVTLQVREPDRKVEVFLAKGKETATVGQTIELQLAVKNIGSDPLFDLSVETTLPEGLSFAAEPEKEIIALPPNQMQLLSFSVISSSEGRFQIGCKIIYTDLNAEESSCQDSVVVFQQPGISPMIYGGIGLALIAVIVFIYFNLEEITGIKNRFKKTKAEK
jgi:uncharacterized repeat protein (TIGR01451 family)